MTRGLYTTDEVKDNFRCAIRLAVAGGLWSDDVRTVVAALTDGFGLALDLPPALTVTTIEAIPAPTGSANAEAARLFAALVRMAKREQVV